MTWRLEKIQFNQFFNQTIMYKETYDIRDALTASGYFNV